MLSLFFKPELNQPLYFPVCEGDEVSISTLLPYEVYEWSNGEGTAVIAPTEPGTYSLKVMNELGCIGYTDTLTLEIIPLPEVDVWPVFDTLYTAFAGNWTYQWLQGENEIDGANSHYFVPTASGSYSVVVTDDLGCSNQSEEFAFVITNLTDTPGADNFKVFPVPFSQELAISGSKSIDALQLWSAEGKLVYQREVPVQANDLMRINTSGFAPGVYVLSIRSGNSIEMMQLICQ